MERCSYSDFHPEKHEYWGPVSVEFTDAYLDMLFHDLSRSKQKFKKGYKRIFSVATELLHNIADYNLRKYQDELPSSYFSIELLESTAVFRSYNTVRKECRAEIEDRFRELEGMSRESIDDMISNSLKENQSLGLLLLCRQIGDGFHWEFSDRDDLDWLKIIVTQNYGSTNN